MAGVYVTVLQEDADADVCAEAIRIIIESVKMKCFMKIFIYYGYDLIL